MNCIQRIAAAATVSAAVVAPATIGPAFAEPYPWHGPSEGASQPLQKTKAQIEYEEQLQQEQFGPGNEPLSGTTSDATGFPWDTVGLAALGAGAIAAGGAVVVRRNHRVPTHA